jgi:C_GCAxxG_C_C family probable redox protein
MKNFSEQAKQFFLQGQSCSESIVNAAWETGLIDKTIDPELINKIASPFSGAMGTHQCLCGAVAGSQIVLGLIFGRKSFLQDPNNIKISAREFLNNFKAKKGSFCCKSIKANIEKVMPGKGRQACADLIYDTAEILYSMIEKRINPKVF